MAPNQATNQLRHLRIEYEKKIAENIKTNPKLFFKYVNRNSQKKFTPTSLISETGIVTEDPSSILELFGDYFASVFLSHLNFH
jgi:hypothetical protein